jgi:hypothetical protein
MNPNKTAKKEEFSDPQKAPRWLWGMVVAGVEKAGSLEELGKHIHSARPTILGWRDGATPRLDKVEALINFVGGDLSRALPGYDPAQDAKALDRRYTDQLKRRIDILEGAIADAREALDKIDSRLDGVIQIAADSNGEGEIVERVEI